MNALTFLIHDSAVQRFGWVLIHFLWEGAAIGLLLAAMLPLLNRVSAHLRYLVICQALLSCAAAPAVTWMMLERQDRPAYPSPSATPENVNGGMLRWPQPVPSLPTSVQGSDLSVDTGGPMPRVPWYTAGLRMLNEMLPYTVILWGSGCCC